MPTWGPATHTIGPGSVTPDHRSVVLFDTGTFPVNAITQINGTVHVTFGGGRSDAVWDNFVQAFVANGDSFEAKNLIQFRLTTSDATWSYNVPLGVTHVVISFDGSLYAGQTMTCTASGNFSTDVHCIYGTQPISTAPPSLILTPSSILDVLEHYGAPTLFTVFQKLVGLAVDVVGLCQNPPGQLPAINSNLQLASIDELVAVFRVMAWHTLCQCTPGAPEPLPFPEPPVQVPTTWPAAPSYPCDPADLCTSIADIRQTIHFLQGAIAETLQLVELQQRYRLPFAYINGAAHSGLQGSGGFVVSRLLGLQIAITSKPGGAEILPGNPPYVWNAGWLSITDDNGMYEEKRLTRDLQLWFPQGMPAASHFQWDLYPEFIIRVTELQAEP